MYILNFEAFLVAITLLTITPGIDTVLVIKNTSRSGGKDGVVTSLGICLGLIVHATFSAVGISAILLQSAELFQVMKWVGAAYLIWLGVSGLRAAFKGNVAMETHVIGDSETWAKLVNHAFSLLAFLHKSNEEPHNLTERLWLQGVVL